MELDSVWINNTDVKMNDLGHIATLIVLILFHEQKDTFAYVMF